MADDTLMDLIDAYAEARHVGGCHTYNTKTAEARAKVVAALAAAPQGVAYAELHQRVEELIEKESELRRVVEIIALGESANPVIDAGDELVSLGYWDAGAVAALRASNGQAPVGATSEPIAYLHDDGYWTPAKTAEGRKLNDRLHFAGSPKIGVHLAPTAQAAPAAGAVAGPRSGVELARDLKNAIDTAMELRQQLRLMEEHARGEIWRWQADGANDLATMGNRMGVLIYASDLRNLLATAPTPAAQADSVLEDAAASEVLMEHSGCGSGTQVDMLTVRLNPGDKVIMLKGRITQAIDAARKQGGL